MVLSKASSLRKGIFFNFISTFKRTWLAINRPINMKRINELEELKNKLHEHVTFKF